MDPTASEGSCSAGSSLRPGSSWRAGSCSQAQRSCRTERWDCHWIYLFPRSHPWENCVAQSSHGAQYCAPRLPNAVLRQPTEEDNR